MEPVVRQAAQTSDFRLVTQYHNAAFHDILAMITKFMSVKGPTFDTVEMESANTSSDVTPFITCGIWCNAFGECNYQQPGKICMLRNLN